MPCAKMFASRVCSLERRDSSVRAAEPFHFRARLPSVVCPPRTGIRVVGQRENNSAPETEI